MRLRGTIHTARWRTLLPRATQPTPGSLVWQPARTLRDVYRRVSLCSRTRPARHASKADAARYAAQLAALHEVLDGTGGLGALYNTQQPELAALALWRDAFGARLASGKLPDATIRAFAADYAARYGHSIADVAISVEELLAIHRAVWVGPDPHLDGAFPGTLIERARHDLARVLGGLPSRLTAPQASQLREVLTPIAAFVERARRSSRDLDATAAHLRRVRAITEKACRSASPPPQDGVLPS